MFLHIPFWGNMGNVSLAWGVYFPKCETSSCPLRKGCFSGCSTKGGILGALSPHPSKKTKLLGLPREKRRLWVVPNKTTRYKKLCLDFTFIYFLFTCTPRFSFYFQCSLAESLTCHSLLCLILSNFNLLFPFSTETHFPCFPCSGDGGTPGKHCTMTPHIFV